MKTSVSKETFAKSLTTRTRNFELCDKKRLQNRFFSCSYGAQGESFNPNRICLKSIFKQYAW